MFITPRGADFWRPWIVAAILSAMAIAAFVGMNRADAAVLRASFYGGESGTKTASGARFRPMGKTAASWRYPLGTRLSVCLVGCATVTVNDRGPARRLHRDIDLSLGAARAIGLERRGVALVSAAVLGRVSPSLRHGRHHRRRNHC